jgi:hypothetical protein
MESGPGYTFEKTKVMKIQISKNQLGEKQSVEFKHNAKQGQRTMYVLSDQEIQIKPS